MSLKNLYQVKCDGCGECLPACGNEVEAQRQARNRAWLWHLSPSTNSYFHLCLACAERPRPSWWPKPVRQTLGV